MGENVQYAQMRKKIHLFIIFWHSARRNLLLSFWNRQGGGWRSGHPPPQPWGSGSPRQPQNQSKQWPSNALNPAQRGCPARGGQQEAGPQLALLRRFIRGGGGARWTPGIGPHTDDGGCPFHGRLGRSLADDLRDLRPGEAAMRGP